MRFSSTLFFTMTTILASACGDDGGQSTDDDDATDARPNEDIGFAKPGMALKANNEVDDDVWQEIGPADLSCLNTPSSDTALATAVMTSGLVRDFQSDSLNPGTVIFAFPNQDVGSPFAAAVTADQEAKVAFTIPAGTTRYGYKMTNEDSLDTLLLNQYLTTEERAGTPPVDVGDIQVVSKSTGDTLPALIGATRTPGRGILAGAVRDCNNDEISNFIATVSSSEASATSSFDDVTPLPGVDTYYFSAAVGLPVRHTARDRSNSDGLFMAIEMEPTADAYIQVWGYKNDADVASDNMSLISQLKTSVIADTVITGSYEPLRN